MNKSWFLAVVCTVGFSLFSYGQTFRLQGVVRDSSTQKTIENVVVEAIANGSASNSTFNAVSNTKGEYSLSLPSGNYQVSLMVLGYNTISFNIQVDGDTNKDFNLSQQQIPLGEIVVSSFRVNRRLKQIPTPLVVVESQDYQQQSSLTLSNVLATEPGIAMGSDGVWATNINIRGLSENRLVTLIDGDRVETATDLTASLSMVDVNDIDRVEIVKGAQSSLYGTGAMGGIVNIITKDGHFASSPYISGNITSGYASANKLYSEHADVSTGSNDWYVRLSGTYNNADDIRTPEGILPNSQFKTNNITAKVGVKPTKNQLLKIQFQRNWSTDVGIPGGSAFPGPATATYSDIGRELLNLSYEIKNITEKLTSLKLNYFTQYILRDVEMNPNTVTTATLPNGNTQRVTPTLITPTGKHLTHGIQLQSTWKLTNTNTLIAGTDMWGRWLTTSRKKYITVDVLNPSGDILATNYLVRGETPIPNSNFKSAGIFVQDEAHLLNNKLTLLAGGRMDGIWVKNDQGYDVDYIITNDVINNSPATQRITFEKGSENSLSWSANAGAIYKLSEDVDLTANVARSFRSPSLEERFKYIDLGNLVRLGDPSLKPEKGYSADLGLKIWKPKFNLQLGTFANWISDMIVETSGEFIYTLTAGTTDTLPALINANVSKALLYGFDFGFQYNFYSNFVLFGTGSFVRGKDTEEDTNLPQIPPLNGRLGLRYTLPKIGSAEVTVIGATKQDKIAGGEVETGGYTRLDLAISSTKINIGTTKLQLFGGIDNVTDRKYTNHLATNRGDISVEPGINIYLRANLSF
ncbi:MAG TPA: TonB-dependent receptor [Tenuifilaceae bacterium]|nr:TonB-dependent receptor [Tenuifilaceae bacterium]